MTLALGVVLAVGALVYVLYPLLRLRPAPRSMEVAPPPPAEGPAVRRDVTDDEIEAAIRAYRVSRSEPPTCASCGPRPEADALYCSSCGRPLGGTRAGG